MNMNSPLQAPTISKFCRIHHGDMAGLETLHEQRIHHLRKRMLLQACRVQQRFQTLAAEPESGMATAEYAVVLIAATGFAGLLVTILKSGAVKSLLTELVNRALNVG